MAEVNLQEIHDLLVDIAHEAGRMQMAATPSYLSSGTKKNNSVDLVTETDQAVEKMVSTRLLAAHPDFKFIGEETYYPGQKLTSEPTFIVDPIDGTTNFVHGYSSFCISLGFALDKVPTVGVIYNPLLDELYTGIRGRGAYLRKNGGAARRLPLKQDPEPLKDLSTCLVGMEWGHDRSGRNFDTKCRVMAQLAASKEQGGAMAHSIRCIGSAALNLAAIAAGQLDLWWEGGCWAWDVCAGWCILAESGGIMVGANPGDWEIEIDCRKYLAVRGAPSGQRAIVEELWGIVGEGKLEYES